MDDSLSFVGLQDPGVKPSEGLMRLSFHILGMPSQTHWGGPSSGVREDESAGGLSAVSVLECKPLFKTSEAQSLGFWTLLCGNEVHWINMTSVFDSAGV